MNTWAVDQVQNIWFTALFSVSSVIRNLLPVVRRPFTVRHMEIETSDNQTSDVRRLLSFVVSIELSAVVCNRKWLERVLRGGGLVPKTVFSHTVSITRPYGALATVHQKVASRRRQSSGASGRIYKKSSRSDTAKV